jgi:hypothetical protein
METSVPPLSCRNRFSVKRSTGPKNQPIDVPIVPCKCATLAWHYRPGPTLGRRLMVSVSRRGRPAGQCSASRVTNSGVTADHCCAAVRAAIGVTPIARGIPIAVGNTRAISVARRIPVIIAGAVPIAVCVAGVVAAVIAVISRCPEGRLRCTDSPAHDAGRTGAGPPAPSPMPVPLGRSWCGCGKKTESGYYGRCSAE